MTHSSSHAECGDAAGESGDDALKCLSFFQNHPQDGELEIQQLDEEVCALRVTIQDLLSQSTELDHKRSDVSHELHLLHSMINDKRSRMTVQKLVEFQEQLKDLERRESGLESKLLICEEEFSNLSESKSGSINLDIHLSDSINKFNSLKKKLPAKMRASFSLRCQLNDAPVQTELIQYEKRFSELYAQIQEKHRLTRRYYATYNALLEIKELMLKEASLLNSINLQFKDAMTTPSGRSKLLDTMEVIFKGTKQTLKLSAPLATGLILVSCCPGGQASNVATYISKGNVALSVLMTTCSTIGAIIMTPLLTKLLAGQLVPVDAAGLAVSTFQVVLVPTIVGVLAHEYFPKFSERIISVTPLIGVILTTLLCASPIGQVSEVLKSQGGQLIIPVALLHAAAFALGYWLSRLSAFGESTSRTISIECGMQSSALGFLLAQKHFTNPLVAVPSAVSVVCMALGGSALAVFWRNMPIAVNDKDDFKE